MAKVRSITIGFTRKYQHPHISFENFQIEGAITVDLEEGETPAEAVLEAVRGVGYLVNDMREQSGVPG